MRGCSINNLEGSTTSKQRKIGCGKVGEKVYTISASCLKLSVLCYHITVGGGGAANPILNQSF